MFVLPPGHGEKTPAVGMIVMRVTGMLTPVGPRWSGYDLSKIPVTESLNSMCLSSQIFEPGSGWRVVVRISKIFKVRYK